MSRPKLTFLKVGDKVTCGKKEGVVVFVEPHATKQYSVHFHPTGRGYFDFNQLTKAKPLFKLKDLIDEDEEVTEDSLDKETSDV